MTSIANTKEAVGEAYDRSCAPRGNAAWDAPRPANRRPTWRLRTSDAERHGMYSRTGAWER